MVVVVFFNVGHRKDAALFSEFCYLDYQNLSLVVCCSPLLLTHVGRHLVRTRGRGL